MTQSKPLPKLDFFLDRYQSLFDILKKLESDKGAWSLYDGMPFSERSEQTILPDDISAFLKIFGVDSQIGVNGYNVLNVDYPSIYHNSDICNLGYLSSSEFNEETPNQLFADTEIPLKFILFWGYNVDCEVFCYDSSRQPLTVCANYLIQKENFKTFNDVLCAHLIRYGQDHTDILNWLEL